jgi:hypothetical protein
MSFLRADASVDFTGFCSIPCSFPRDALTASTIVGGHGVELRAQRDSNRNRAAGDVVRDVARHSRHAFVI